MTTTSARRARKQPAEVRRETVLDAAIRVFARLSFRAAGTAAIARAAGIAEPTIYRYYSSKRDLYLAALTRCGDVVRDEFVAINASTPDAAAALSAMGQWYEQMVIADPAYLRLRQRAVSETDDPEIQHMLRAFYTEIHGVIREVIQRGQRQGSLRRELSADGAAWMFLALGQILDLSRLIGMTADESMVVCALAANTMKQALLVVPPT